MELENIILTEVRLRRPKTMQQYCGMLVRLWGMLHAGGIGQGKETKNFNVVDVLTVQE
jgi:hypothetical protein